MELKSILEAAMLAAARPLNLDEFAGLFEETERPAPPDLLTALEELDRDCAGRPVELKRVASGYRLQVRAAFSPWVSRLFEERPGRYSRAFLETLAIIAYRQPVTRGDIEDIRGVAVSSSIIKTLQERDWIHVVGHKEVPGRPALLATTRRFLDYFNLTALSDLPPLHAFVEQLDSAVAESASPEAASAPISLDTHDTNHAETDPTPAPETPD